MTDVASLLDSMELRCTVCGRRGPDDFADRAGLDAFMSAPTIPVVAGLVPSAAGIREIHPGDVERFGPVHRRCIRPPKGPTSGPSGLLARIQQAMRPPDRQRLPYNADRSVA